MNSCVEHEWNSTDDGVLLVIQKVTADFAEDPFKDYRYEDVFNIEDPFADELDNNSSSMDDIFSAPKPGILLFVYILF